MVSDEKEAPQDTITTMTATAHLSDLFFDLVANQVWRAEETRASKTNLALDCGEPQKSHPEAVREDWRIQARLEVFDALRQSQSKGAAPRRSGCFGWHTGRPSGPSRAPRVLRAAHGAAREGRA